MRLLLTATSFCFLFVTTASAQRDAFADSVFASHRPLAQDRWGLFGRRYYLNHQRVEPRRFFLALTEAGPLIASGVHTFRRRNRRGLWLESIGSVCSAIGLQMLGNRSPQPRGATAGLAVFAGGAAVEITGLLFQFSGRRALRRAVRLYNEPVDASGRVQMTDRAGGRWSVRW